MVNLLTAFVLFHFNAHWLWWVGFAVFVTIDVLYFLLEAFGNG
jgi:hypothetical protein